MDKGIWFWVIYVIFVVLGLFFNWPMGDAPGGTYRWRPVGWSVVVLILIFLLGWGTFGPPIR